MRRMTLSLAVALIASVGAGAFAQEKAKPAKAALKVAFPKGFRNWKHVKSMVIYDSKHPLFDAFGGIHHVYANGQAMKGLQAKAKDYPAGAVFAFDLLEASEQGGAFAEGKRKFVAVMVRDPKRYGETSGWGWQAWEGGDAQKPTLKTALDQKACATCHRERGAQGWVFTELRD